MTFGTEGRLGEWTEQKSVNYVLQKPRYISGFLRQYFKKENRRTEGGTEVSFGVAV